MTSGAIANAKAASALCEVISVQCTRAATPPNQITLRASHKRQSI